MPTKQFLYNLKSTFVLHHAQSHNNSFKILISLNYPQIPRQKVLEISSGILRCLDKSLLIINVQQIDSEDLKQTRFYKFNYRVTYSLSFLRKKDC